jgi:diguanylate cyclase (GGDEF)-like protein/PAS domain S-box-containing protein
MSGAVTGVNAAVAGRLENASEWMLHSHLPMLLAHRNGIWQPNAALLALLESEAPAPATPPSDSPSPLDDNRPASAATKGGAMWPQSLRDAVATALDQADPAPVYECALGTPGRAPRTQTKVIHQPWPQALQGADDIAYTLWCNLYFTRVDPDCVLCILVDVSACIVNERRLALAEKAAYARDMAYAVVYGNMEEVAFHIRLDPDDQFRYVSVNHAFCAAANLAQEAIVGKLVQEITPEPSFSVANKKFREVIATGTSVRWEQVRSYPAGQGRIGAVSIAPVHDASGKISELIGTVHDITQLKKAEQQLRDVNAHLAQTAAELQVNEERLAFALDSAGEGVWDWDIAANTMFYSKRFKEILGHDPHEAIGYEFWWSQVHPDDVERVHAHLQACLAEPDIMCIDVHRVHHADGHWIWIEARGSIVSCDAAGVPTRMVGTIVDITATTELRQELERSHELLTQLAQQVPGALFQLNMTPAGLVTVPFVSTMSTEVFQLEPAQIQDNIRLLLGRIHRRDRWRLRQGLRDSARNMTPWRAEYRVAIGAHGWCWRELAAKPALRADGSVVWHGFTNDISERKRTEDTIRQFNQKLERRAHYDALTGLPNRMLFRDRLEQEMRHASIGTHGMALLFIDLDRFKEVNDLLGHDAGDNLLALVAGRIGAELRPGDTVARLGGDEFTVILTETSEVEHIEQTAQSIIDALRKPFQLGVEQVSISGSVGITLYPGDGKLPEDLMRNADHAMYRSKAAGRNQLTFFEPAMQRAALQRLKLTGELRQALRAHQLELHFQPILDNQTGLISKAEALLRWRRPGHDLMMPAEFIGIAEETGMIHDIGNWVFFEAVEWSAHWSRMLGRTLQISINKSPIQFLPHGYTNDWIGHLDRRGLPHNSIAVEITEGVLLHLSEPVFQRLHELQRGGVEVSIDDFGTGYSSMSYLKRLDIDYLKIDQSFVAEMLHDRTSLTITETIIVMAHKLGLKVIAEGVETTAQRACLNNHGCDFVQGYLFAQPLPANEFEKLLLRQPFSTSAGRHRVQ